LLSSMNKISLLAWSKSPKTLISFFFLFFTIQFLLFYFYCTLTLKFLTWKRIGLDKIWG
jgi:hypothetical protein